MVPRSIATAGAEQDILTQVKRMDHENFTIRVSNADLSQL
jgi:hypothetical protein